MNPNADATKSRGSGIAGLKLFRGRLVHHVYAKHIHKTYTIGLRSFHHQVGLPPHSYHLHR